MRHPSHPVLNPVGSAFTESETDLTSVHAAIRMASSESARVWRIKNPARLHAFTRRPVAYHLFPAPVRVA